MNSGKKTNTFSSLKNELNKQFLNQHIFTPNLQSNHEKKPKDEVKEGSNIDGFVVVLEKS